MTQDIRAFARAVLADATTVERPSLGAAVVAVWTRLEGHFGELVGTSAMRTLMERSLALATVRRSWLVSVDPRAGVGVETWRLLRVAIDRQLPDEAHAGFAAVFATLLALLARLIGEHLVGIHLRQLWPDLPASAS